MKTPEEIADEAIAAFTLIDRNGVAEVQEHDWGFIKDRIIAAIAKDREQFPRRAMETRPSIYWQDAAHLLWVCGDRGPEALQPGDNTHALIEAALGADTVAAERMAKGFPSLMAAVYLHRHSTKGTQALRRIVSDHAAGE